MKRDQHQLRNNILAIIGVSAVLTVLVVSLARRNHNAVSLPIESPSMSELIRQNLSDHEVVPLVIGERRVWVEVVTTQSSITQGLSGRDQIGRVHADTARPISPSQGMLFVLPERRVPTFWMYEMQFDLDMVWIRDGEVRQITERVPRPSTNTTELPRYSPREAMDMVLELPAGLAGSLGVKPGDKLIFPTLNTTDGPGRK